jgi:photosystem II stability/assembly factor-like uncharacterized protein
VFLIGVGFPYSGNIQAAQAEFKLQTASPTVSSVDPATALNDVDTPVTITGTGFVEEEGGVTITAYLGTTELENVVWVSDTELTATVPWGMDPGTYDLNVENPNGQTGTLVDAFTLTTNLSVSAMDPTSGPNDLDTEVTITGTGFIPEREGETVMSPPTVTLGSTELVDVIWVSTTELTGTVPWGMDPGTYTLTVENPSGEADTLTDAFTAEEGINVWNPTNLFGGSIVEILINPDSPDTIYAEAQEVGLFRSMDGGDSWTFLLSPNADNVALDDTSPNILYVHGPGHPGDSPPLYRSVNGGDTWEVLDVSFPVTETDGRYCWRSEQLKPYVVSGVLYVSACGHGGMYSGLVKSTDHGDTWEAVVDGMTDSQITDLAFHPQDPNTVYAGTANGNVFISDDGGDSWSLSSQPVGYVHELEVNPFGSHEVWVAAESRFGDDPGVYKSTDSSATDWEAVNPPGGVGYLDNYIGFAPQAWGASYDGVVYVASGYTSSDGGQTWTSYGPGDTFEFTPHPTNPQILYAGVIGAGVYKSEDGGSTWQKANQGLRGICLREIESETHSTDTFYGRSNLVKSVYKGTRGGEEWQELSLEAANSLLVDPFDSERVYAGVARGVEISYDGGQTWSNFIEIDPPAAYADANWYWPIVLRASPTTEGELFAGFSHKDENYLFTAGSIARSIDGGQTWNQTTLPDIVGDLRDMAIDPTNPSVMYAATGNVGNDGFGKMLRSMDRGMTWEFLEVGNVSNIEVEPGTGRVFIPGMAFDTSGVCISEDQGETWDCVGYGPNVDQFIFAPGDPPVIYAPTPDGLSKSEDSGQSWSKAEGSLGQVPIYSVEVGESGGRFVLYVSTCGGYVTTSVTGVEGVVQSGSLVEAGVYRWTSIVPTFSDVPVDHWAFDWIEALYNAGLTSGYPDGTYRPSNPVTRAEMTVFLLKGMNTGTYSPPAPDGSHPFSDISGHWAESWMEELYDVGLTSGYPDGTYRPQNEVTRAEMAVFLLRAKHGAGYSPPVTSGGTFSDIAGHWAEDWIEQLAAEGITSGYVDGTYRPENPVTRAEMAVFLTRTFDLPIP